MADKRVYARHKCRIKIRFKYYEGNPDGFDINKTVPSDGSGLMLDISLGGMFLICNESVQPGMPIEVIFKLEKKKISIKGRIVRTGSTKNNPSPLLKSFSLLSMKKDNYVAVIFDSPVSELPGIQNSN